MIRLALTLLVIALTGCESTKRFCDDHPVACPVLIGTVTTSLLLCAHDLNGHSQGKTMPSTNVGTQPVTCTTAGNCK